MRLLADANGNIYVKSNGDVLVDDRDPGVPSGIIDGTLTEFVMPTGKTEIKPYRFRDFTALTSADLRGCTTVGSYAFYGCTNLTTLNFSPLTSIGSYAFRNCKISKLAGAFTTIGVQAFQICSSLQKVEISECTSIGSYAFSGCENITKLHIKITGAIGESAFDGLTKANDVNIDKTSVVTSLGRSAFAGLGYSRTIPSSRIIVLDFSNSTFTSVPTYGFGSSVSGQRLKYFDVILPTTVSRVENYAFRYSDGCNFFFKSTTPPTLATTTCWTGASGYKIFVPYNNVNAYRTATNWTAQSSYIRGFSAEGTFNVGDTLPTVNSEGFALTWYSNKAMTTTVTTVSDANAMYYCTVAY